jgi:hypothetical protein
LDSNGLGEKLFVVHVHSYHTTPAAASSLHENPA